MNSLSKAVILLPLLVSHAAPEAPNASPQFVPSWPCELPGQTIAPERASNWTKTAPGILLEHEILPHRKAMGWNAYYKQVAKFVSEHFQKEANALQPQGQPQQRATRLRIVEIGTAFGGNANNLLKTIPHAELCAVDPFLGGYDKNDKTSSRYGRMKSALREAIHASDEHFWPPFSRAYAQGMASNMKGSTVRRKATLAFADALTRCTVPSVMTITFSPTVKQ